MNRFSFVLGLCALGAAGSALAADDTGSWYINPMAQWTVLQSERPASDDAGFQIGLGRNLSPQWALEANVGKSSFDAANRGRLNLTNYGLDLVRRFGILSDYKIQPFLLIGVGGSSDKLTNFSRSQSFGGEVGAGLMWAFGKQDGPKKLKLRTEVKRHAAFSTTSYGVSDPNDTIFGVGLQYQFGGPAPVAAAPAAPAAPSDSDNDGVTDDMDKCPDTPAGAKVDASGCELDSDGDGVVDRLDQCPDTPKGTPVNAVGCPLDSDGDGVLDADDRCPNTPKGDRVDVHGCTLSGEIKLPGVNFNTDSAVLLPESTSVLDDAAATLKKYPDIVVQVDGHTDDRGSTKHNLNLSQKRAEAVATYLKDHGVTNKMSSKGFGESAPITDNKTEAGRLENRRVTLKIAGG